MRAPLRMAPIRAVAGILSGPMEAEELMPDWLIARLAAVYAAAGGGLMAYGGQTLCDGRRRDRGGDGAWCAVFVRHEQWLVLMLAPALLAMLVVLVFPRGHDHRLRAWLALAVADAVFVCFGAAL